MNQLKKACTHIKENKSTYIALGAGLVIGGATVYLIGSPASKQIVDSFKIYYKSPHTSVNQVITNLERRGHPGFLIKCKETGEVFASQSRAADILKVNPGDLSKHLNGTKDHAGGLHFERLGLAA